MNRIKIIFQGTRVLFFILKRGKMKNDLKIEHKSISDLKPYANNPRINDGAVDAVASSIKNFGFKVPIVIDESDEIIAGHTRLKAAKKLGLKKVPCIIADDLTPEQVKAFRLADNKTSELAVWDWDTLEKELGEIAKFNLDFQMSDFGFCDNDFDEGLLDDLFEASTKEKTKEDRFITCPSCGHKFKES